MFRKILFGEKINPIFVTNFLKMIQVNYSTYQLYKEEKLLAETEAATFDKAIDYFFELHPKAYGDDSYSFKRVPMAHER
jgi:hypothetical protein